jgi:hypothetical protein
LELNFWVLSVGFGSLGSALGWVLLVFGFSVTKSTGPYQYLVVQPDRFRQIPAS